MSHCSMGSSSLPSAGWGPYVVTLASLAWKRRAKVAYDAAG